MMNVEKGLKLLIFLLLFSLFSFVGILIKNKLGLEIAIFFTTLGLPILLKLMKVIKGSGHKLQASGPFRENRH